MVGSEIINAVEHLLTYVVLTGAIWLLANALHKKSTFIIEKDSEGEVRQIAQLTDRVAVIEAERTRAHPEQIISADPAIRRGVTPPSPDDEIDNLGERGPGGE